MKSKNKFIQALFDFSEKIKKNGDIVNFERFESYSWKDDTYYYDFTIYDYPQGKVYSIMIFYSISKTQYAPLMSLEFTENNVIGFESNEDMVKIACNHELVAGVGETRWD